MQIDNKKTIKDIQNEAQKTTNDLKRQLEELNKKHSDLQTEHNFACAALTLKEKAKVGQESIASANKITQSTLELGEQRKNNEDLRKQMQELFANFTAYRSGHLKSSIEIDSNSYTCDRHKSIIDRNRLVTGYERYEYE